MLDKLTAIYTYSCDMNICASMLRFFTISQDSGATFLPGEFEAQYKAFSFNIKAMAIYHNAVSNAQFGFCILYIWKCCYG